MKPESAFTRCLYCQRGRNGSRTCSGAVNTSRVYGCFLGTVIPGKEQANAKPYMPAKRTGEREVQP